MGDVFNDRPTRLTLTGYIPSIQSRPDVNFDLIHQVFHRGPRLGVSGGQMPAMPASIALNYLHTGACMRAGIGR